jgi:hypothetical protein
MGESLRSSDKWRFTFYTVLVAVLIFNPWTYKLVNSLVSGFLGSIANAAGCPTLFGFGVHIVVFTLIIRYLMDLHL